MGRDGSGGHRRAPEIGLGPWVLLLGASIIGGLSDPAVIGSPGTIYWFAFGAVILGIGVGMLLVDARGKRAS